MKYLHRLSRFASSWTGTIIIVLLVIFFIAQAFIIPSRSMVGTLYEGDMLFVKKFAYGIPIPKIPYLELPVFPDINNNGHVLAASGPTRGEIVVFIPPDKPKTYYVKRNFAVGGDEVVFSIGGFYLRPHEGDAYIRAHYDSEKLATIMGKLYVHEPYMDEHPGIFYGKNNATYAIMVALLNSYSTDLKIAMEERQWRGNLIFYKKIPKDSYFMIGDNRDGSEDSRFFGAVPYSHIIGTPWFIYFSITLPATPNIAPKDRFVIRWKRMFKTPAMLEEALRREKEEVLSGVVAGYKSRDVGVGL